MMIYFISRHKGALEWAQRNGFENAEVIAHFDPSVVRGGDIVIGTLPVHLAGQVCGKGGRYFHLSMSVPADRRGTEISADDMDEFGACLQEFRVVPTGDYKSLESLKK